MYGMTLPAGTPMHDTALTVQVRAVYFGGQIKVDAVYIDYASAFGSVDLTGAFTQSGGWGVYGNPVTHVQWNEHGGYINDSYSSSSLTFATFPTAGIDPRATLVGSSFILNQQWSFNSSGSTSSITPHLYCAKNPISSPSTNTPRSRVSPMTFAVSNGYSCGDVALEPSAPATVLLPPNPMEYGYVGWSWAGGSQESGGYVPTLANFNAGQVAMGFDVDQYFHGSPFGTYLTTDLYSPILRIYYDAAPISPVMFMEA
jgi:hypothetical protein